MGSLLKNSIFKDFDFADALTKQNLKDKAELKKMHRQEKRCHSVAKTRKLNGYGVPIYQAQI